MAHQMTVTLSDQEYNALKAQAAKNGQQLEILLHELMTRQLQLSSLSETTKRPLTGQERVHGATIPRRETAQYSYKTTLNARRAN